MAGGQEDTTIGLILANDVGGCRGREDTVSANNELLDPVGGGNLENLLDGRLGIVPPITSYDNSGTLGRGGIENGLDEVLSVML